MAIASPVQASNPIKTDSLVPRVATTADEAITQARQTGKPVDVVGETSTTDTVTANPNGSLTLKRHVVPVRKKVAGAWRNLDATLRRNADGTISPALTSADLALSGGGNGPLVTMRQLDKKLALSLPVSLPAPTLLGATATYASVLPGVDLQVTATSQGGFAQVFVVKDAIAAANPALKTLVMKISVDGLTVAADESGAMSATDKSGRALFNATSPVMWSSAKAADAQAKSAGVQAPDAATPVAKVGVKVAGDTIELTPDAALLNGPGTVYPVYIDPPWTPVMPSSSGVRTGYASVASAFPTSSKWNNTADPNPDNLQLGWANTPWHARTMVNFALDLGKLNGATISEAHIDATSVHSGSCTARKTRVFAPTTTLNSGNATWNNWYNNIPLGPEVGSATFSGGYNSSCPAHGVTFPVLPGVAAAVAAGRSTQTFVFTGDTNETSDTASYKELSLASLALAITYNHTPTTPTGLFTSPQTGCTGTVSAVGDGDVMLYAPVSDADGGTVGVHFEAWKSSAPGTLIASTDPVTTPATSGGNAQLTLAQTLLKAQAGSSMTEFSWRVQISDGFATSPWSDTCKFNYDPTRPGAPGVTAPAEGSTHIGQSVNIVVTKPVGGTIPTSYVYQLNAGAPQTVAANGAGGATITVTPTRRTNVLTINSLSAGGNPSVDAAVISFTTAPLTQNAADADLTGDGLADLVTVGGVNGLASGLWLAPNRGSSQVVANAGNIGGNGNGVVGDNSAANFNGAQTFTGVFRGMGLQDVYVYYPATGAASIITGSGDGSSLQPQFSGNQSNVFTVELKDNDGVSPLQLAAAGNSIDNTPPDNTADLISIGGTTGNYRLNYYFYASPGNLQGVYPLDNPTPAANMAWDQWRIATAEVKVGGTAQTDMFLWNPTTGAVHLWRDLTLDGETGLLTFTPYLLKSSGWNTGTALTLQAADIDNNGTPDLWTTGAGRVVTAHLTSALTGTTGTLTTQSSLALSTVTHTWALNDMPGGSANGSVLASSNDSAPAGTSAKNLTGNSGTTWHTGDLFSPDVQLNGTGGTLAASGPALSTNADFSVSVWVKPSAAGGTVLSQDGSNTAGFRLFADPATKSWRFALSLSDIAAPTWHTASAPNNTVQIGVWTRLTATYSATSAMMNLAVNDVTVATATHAASWNATGALRIGATKAADYLTGQVANVQVWNQVVDLTGASRSLLADSKADVIRKEGGNLYGFFNGGVSGANGKWDSPPEGYSVGSGFEGVNNSSLYFADLNGDNRRDLIRKQPDGVMYVQYGSATANWSMSGSWYLIGNGWTMADTSIYFADLSGDGYDDLIKKNGTTLEAYYNNGVNGSGGISWLQATATTGFVIGTGWGMADTALHFADISGEGRADIIRKGAGFLGAYYNQGVTGGMGINWDYDTVNGGYQIGSGWNMPDTSIYFADLTGEGRADIVRKDTGSLNVYYNGGVNGNKSIAWDYVGSGYVVSSGWSSYPDSSVHIG